MINACKTMNTVAIAPSSDNNDRPARRAAAAAKPDSTGPTVKPMANSDKWVAMAPGCNPATSRNQVPTHKPWTLKPVAILVMASGATRLNKGSR